MEVKKRQRRKGCCAGKTWVGITEAWRRHATSGEPDRSYFPKGFNINKPRA